MNRNVLLAVVQPTDSEIAEAAASFSYTPGGPLDGIDQLPYLVMVRRAYRAGFYTDTLSDTAPAANSPGTSSQRPPAQAKRPRRQSSTTRAVRSP